MQISCLKPKIARAEAEQMLRGSWREARFGALHLVMDFYLPYHLFRVAVVNGCRQSAHLLAIDAVNGSLDLYQLDQTPLERLLIESDCVAPGRLDETRTWQLLEEQVRRGILLKGFFSVGDLRITGVMTDRLYLPYHVGVYERRNRVTLEIIDAVRGRFEGAKLREIVTEWFSIR
jgi:hypothetical protein